MSYGERCCFTDRFTVQSDHLVHPFIILLSVVTFPNKITRVCKVVPNTPVLVCVWSKSFALEGGGGHPSLTKANFTFLFVFSLFGNTTFLQLHAKNSGVCSYCINNSCLSVVLRTRWLRVEEMQSRFCSFPVVCWLRVVQPCAVSPPILPFLFAPHWQMSLFVCVG